MKQIFNPWGSVEVALSLSLKRRLLIGRQKKTLAGGGFQKLSEEVLRRDDRISPTAP